MQMASRNEDTDVTAFRELHCDVCRVGDDCEAVIQRQAANDFCRRGSGRDCNSLAFADQRSGSASNASLLLCQTAYLCEERAIFAEGFVEEWFE